MRLSGNTVLITGGSTGVGYAMTEAFLRKGSTVIIRGRRVDRLEQVKSRHPDVYVEPCDVSKPVERARLVEWVATLSRCSRKRITARFSSLRPRNR